MRLTGPAAHLPAHPTLTVEQQEAIILHAAAEIGVPAPFLAAIRIAENGGPGREFGVLSDAATTFDAQARVAAQSIRNNQYRFVLATQAWPTNEAGAFSEAFVRAMAQRWAPVGADNDPNNLNAHWVTNVLAAYRGSGVA